MDEMNKKPMDTGAPQSPAAREVDEKFRDFFTTTVAVIPEDSMVSGRVDTGEEPEPKKKGLFGWLSGLFRGGDETPDPATGEVLIPGKTEPAAPVEEQPEETGETLLEPVDETLQIDLMMMRSNPEPVLPGDATGEIRLEDLEPEEPEEEQKPAKKSGGIRFLSGDGEKPALGGLKKKEKQAEKPAVQPAEEPAVQPVETVPEVQAEQPAPAVEPAPARKLTFEDIDIAAILAAGAPSRKTGAQPVAEEPRQPAAQPEEDSLLQKLTAELLAGAEEPEQPAARPAVPVAEEQPAEEPADAVRKLFDLTALDAAAKPEQPDEPTGEIVLFPVEEEPTPAPAEETPQEIDLADTREVPDPAPLVEHSTHEPQVVAVEEVTGEVDLLTADEPTGEISLLNADEPTGEVRLFGAEEPAADEPAEEAAPVQEPAAETAEKPNLDDVKEKTRTAAVHLFGEEEPAEETEPEQEETLPPVEEPAPAAAEYEDPADAQAVAAHLHGGVARRTVGAAVTGAIAAVLLVLGLTAQGILLLATPVDPQIAPQAFLGVNLILLAVAAGVALPVFKEGLPGLVGKPSPHTLPAVAAVAAALQLVVCLLLPNGYDPDKTTVFAPLAVLLLFADLLGSRLMYRVVETNFGLVSSGVDHAAAYCLKDKQLAGTLTAGMEEKDPTLLLSRPAALVKDFVAQSFSARRSDATAQKIARILLAGAAVGALLRLVRGGGVVGAFTALAGVICLGAPLSATLIAAVPSLLMQRAASKVGAVVPGWYNVEQLSRVDVVQVDAADLFGAGCVQLEGIKTFRKERIDLAILYATSVLIEGCNTLSDLFHAMIEGKTEMLYGVKDLEKKPGLGLVAWCDNCRVVMGSREMMAQEDIALPPLDYEERYTKDGRHQALYLAVSGQLYALFVLSYRGRKKVKTGLDMLEKNGIRLLVTCEDPTLTAERIENIYKLQRGHVKVLSADEQAALQPATRYMPASEGCMVHLGGFASFMGGLRAAFGANEGERSACLVQTVAVIFSVALGLLLAFTGGIGSLSLLAAALYQAAWSGLSVAITLTKKY